jgi:hypothetical protein
MTDLSGATWRKASLSVHNGACMEIASARWRKSSFSATGNCVEIAPGLPAVVGIRDSKSPENGAHVIARPAFAQFLADARNGRFDLK